jgi:hypothetical protein
MFNPDTSPFVSRFMPSFETAARSLKVVAIVAPVHDDVEIETAIISLGREPGGGLVAMPDVWMQIPAHRAAIISAAARNNVLLCGLFDRFAVDIDAVCVAVDFDFEGHGIVSFPPVVIERRAGCRSKRESRYPSLVVGCGAWCLAADSPYWSNPVPSPVQLPALF